MVKVVAEEQHNSTFHLILLTESLHNDLKIVFKNCPYLFSEFLHDYTALLVRYLQPCILKLIYIFFPIIIKIILNQYS